MSENTFWTFFYSIVGIFLLSLVSIIIINNQMSNNAITKMVADGADPIKAACAISPGELRCAVLYAGK